MIAAPNHPYAITRDRNYAVTFTDPDGNERTFVAHTSFAECVRTVQWLRDNGATGVTWKAAG